MHIYIYHVGVCREPPRVNEIRDLLLADQPHVFRVKNSESKQYSHTTTVLAKLSNCGINESLERYK
jgi:hypothetical protein